MKAGLLSTPMKTKIIHVLTLILLTHPAWNAVTEDTFGSFSSFSSSSSSLSSGFSTFNRFFIRMRTIEFVCELSVWVPVTKVTEAGLFTVLLFPRSSSKMSKLRHGAPEIKLEQELKSVFKYRLYKFNLKRKYSYNPRIPEFPSWNNSYAVKSQSISGSSSIPSPNSPIS